MRALNSDKSCPKIMKEALPNHHPPTDLIEFVLIILVCEKWNAKVGSEIPKYLVNCIILFVFLGWRIRSWRTFGAQKRPRGWTRRWTGRWQRRRWRKFRGLKFWLCFKTLFSFFFKVDKYLLCVFLAKFCLKSSKYCLYIMVVSWNHQQSPSRKIKGTTLKNFVKSLHSTHTLCTKSQNWLKK